REKLAVAEALAADVTRESRRDNGRVTPPEVEVEGEGEVEVNPPADAERLPPEAQPPAAGPQPGTALGGTVPVFAHWKDRCRQGSSKVQLTEQRDRAVRGRLHRDGFTVAELKLAIDGAARATEAWELEYEHRETELYRICIDAEHVRAWITYQRTGDFDVVEDVLAREQSRVSA